MRPPIRALWVDENEDADYELLRPHRFTRLYYAARDPRLTPAYLDDVRAHGYPVGLYWAANWDAELDGAAAARLMNDRWLRLAGNVKLLHVQFDIEQHDPEYVVALLRQWRALRPFASTSWTMEGFQGGWMVAARSAIVATNVLLVPQAYAGGMQPWDGAGVIRDLTDFGFPNDRITLFHDAAELRRGWDGFAFTQRRLR